MKKSSRTAAVLWTGGKDSALALHEAVDQGLEVQRLVTFVPEKPSFQAHPVSFMKLQADALGLQHDCLIVSEPFRENYERVLQQLKEEGIRIVVTGDLAEVDGHPNWIRQCCKPSGMKVLTPLWGKDRLELLDQLIFLKFSVVFSLVRLEVLTSEWVGRELNRDAIRDLRKLRKRNGMDLCGENGEYHTLVLDAPLYQKRIEIKSFSRHRHESMMSIKIESASLILK